MSDSIMETDLLQKFYNLQGEEVSAEAFNALVAQCSDIDQVFQVCLRLYEFFVSVSQRLETGNIDLIIFYQGKVLSVTLENMSDFKLKIEDLEYLLIELDELDLKRLYCQQLEEALVLIEENLTSQYPESWITRF